MLGQTRMAPPRRVVSGAATQWVCDQIAAHNGPVTVLGAFPTAAYLELSSGVVAVLAADAVLLPIGVLLPLASEHLGLAAVAKAVTEVGSASVQLDDLRIEIGERRSARLPHLGTPSPSAIAGAHGLLSRHASYDEVRLLAELPLTALLGRGPGLTPVGDDLLCGLLAGAATFTVDLGSQRHELSQALASRSRATTSLSRQLLYSALAGEGIGQLADLAQSLVTGKPALPEAVAAVTAIGHTSGVALAIGLLAAAERSLG
jgi:hypothetical protein